MIQLNLLPDVKLEYVKAEKRKRVVITLSFLTSAAFLTIFIFLLVFVRFAQKTHINALTDDISSNTQQLTQNEDLNKVLTVQNQLNSLPGLHDDKVVSSRLFDYLTQLTPNNATISDVDIDFLENTLVITGNANNLGTVNKFADTLKFTEYRLNDQTAEEAQANQTTDQELPNAFSDVVLSNFSLVTASGANTNKGATFELTFTFDPQIFSTIETTNKTPIELIVPNIISTRSEVEKPSNLFEAQPVIPSGEAN